MAKTTSSFWKKTSVLVFLGAVALWYVLPLLTYYEQAQTHLRFQGMRSFLIVSPVLAVASFGFIVWLLKRIVQFLQDLAEAGRIESEMFF